MLRHQCLKVVVPEDSVVDAAFLALEVLQHRVESPVVTVARSYEALRVPQVSELTPGRDEGGEVAVFLAEWHAVVTVPRYCDRLPRLLGDRAPAWRECSSPTLLSCKTC